MNQHLPTLHVGLDEALPPTRPARRVRSVRRILTILLGSSLLLAVAPIAAAQAAGTIKGEVKHLGAAVPGAFVIVDNSSQEFIGSEQTGPAGEYAVKVPAAGSYRVEFSPPEGSKLIAQFFEGKPSFATATPVVVAEGETKTGINAALGEGAEITGKVTDSGGNPQQGVDVEVDPIAESDTFFGASGTTGPTGEYVVEGVPPGAEYRVAFFPSSGVNLLVQYFNGKSSFSQATPVPVPTEAPVTNISAVLQVGGAVSGRVTDASTHNPVSNVFVSAFDPNNPEASGFAVTNGNGEYTMVGLPSGSYTVEFFHEGEGGTEYITSFDNGVGVTQGSTTTGINASLSPKAPANTSAPVVSGTPAVGQTLTCSNGSWSGIATIKYAYQWLREGVAITGASGSTYVVQAADQGHGLSCEVTATNGKGHSSAKSNTLAIPPAPVPPAPKPLAPAVPQVKLLASSTLVAKRGIVRVRVSCAAAPCSGSIQLTQQVIVKTRKGKKTIKRRKTLLLGKGLFALAAGRSGTVIVGLTRTGKAKLAHARHHRLAVTLILAVKGGKTIRKTVLLSMAPVRHK